MIPPPEPPNEEKRLAALRALNILDTPPEERFDRLTRLAQRTFGVPIAVISLLDEKRQWFKSCQGLTVSETPLEVVPPTPNLLNRNGRAFATVCPMPIKKDCMTKPVVR